MAYSFYAQTIGQHFSAPKAMTLAYLATGPGVPASRTMDDYGLGGDLSFTVDSAGHLHPPVSAGTNAAELNDAIALAVTRADSAGELSPPPRNAEFPRGRVRLRIHASEVAPQGAMPLLRARVQSLRIDSPPRMLSMPDPKYPDAARSSGISSRVVFRFVIDDSGAVLQNSLQVVEATYREFVTSAAEALLKTRFTPARTAGCPVPMLVQQAVNFKLEP
jgi:TonB family protein